MKAREFLRYVMGEMNGGEGDVVVKNDATGYGYDVSQVSRDGEFLSVVIHPEDWIGTRYEKKKLYAVILLADDKPIRTFGPLQKPEAERIEAVVEGILMARTDATTSIHSEDYNKLRVHTTELEVLGFLDDDTISDAMAEAARDLSDSPDLY